MKILGGLRLHRLLNRPRVRIALAVMILLSVAYQFLPKLLFKVPPTYVGWRDEDFPGRGNKEKQNGLEELTKNELIILHWTALWRQYEPPTILNADTCSALETGTFVQPGSNVFNLPCRISYDRRYLDVGDALVFHSFDLMWEEVPQRHHRKESQLWVYLQRESPIYTKLNLQDYPDTFNWTMTYRRDSDVYHPYAHLVPFSSPNPKNVSISVKSKSRLIAWIVSSCDSHSKREYFVHELQKYVTVDIFGWCGEDCPLTYGDCYGHIESTYKFYLSFENSLCTDYITEKFFNALKTNMVPVVYGGTGTKDYAEIAPKNSYIDARSFKSPQDLANYLLYLDQNEEEYLKYFEWKEKYQVAPSTLGWCNLCQKVFEHLQRVPSPDKKWYKDLWRWWNYMSYDPSVETDEQQAQPSQTAGIGQSYYYKMGTPACFSPQKKFIGGGTGTKPDFEPGLLNGRILGKLTGWAKEAFM